MSQAWLLDIGLTDLVAIGARELLQLIDTPQLSRIPLTPKYCSQIAQWQDRLLPVMDLSQRMPLHAGGFDSAPNLLAIVAYEACPSRQVEVGALMLRRPPVKIEVRNQDALTEARQFEQIAVWGSLAISGFAWQQKTIPVLDLGKVFAPQHITSSNQAVSGKEHSGTSAIAA